MRIVLSLGVLACLAVKTVQATSTYLPESEVLSYKIQPLSYKGEAFFVSQVEAQESRLRALSQNNQTVSLSDLRTTLSASSLLSAASCLFSWGIGAQDLQEKYMRFAQAARYVSVLWPERKALELPREFIALPYYAGLFAGNEEDKCFHLNLWRVWEDELPGTNSVIDCQTLKRDARTLSMQAQKLYQDHIQKVSLAHSEEAELYKNLLLKSATFWKEFLKKSTAPAIEEYLECFENCLLMRRISGPYPGEYNVYASQILGKILTIMPTSTVQECVQGTAYNYAVSLLFKTGLNEKNAPNYKPQIFKEQHLNNGYNLLQKINDSDLYVIEDVMSVACLYDAMGKASSRAGFSHLCYARSAEVCEKVLEFTHDKLTLLNKIKNSYTYAHLFLFSPEMFNVKEVVSWQDWNILLTDSPEIDSDQSDKKEVLAQKYLEKINALSQKIQQEEIRLMSSNTL